MRDLGSGWASVLGFVLGLLVFMGRLLASGLLLGLSTQRLFNSCELVSRPGRAPAHLPLHATWEPAGLWAEDLGLIASNPCPVSGLAFMALISSCHFNDILTKHILPDCYYQYFPGQTQPEPIPPTLLHPNPLSHGRAAVTAQEESSTLSPGPVGLFSELLLLQHCLP